ncbi:MAG: SCP2 sterol-binding domain-containing protein [Chloroflexi bacterium]|nr:SCP2 sterol-binding domain-containing protein [Chloroflexota bacterium]
MPLTISELMSKMPGAFIPEKAAGLDVVIHFKFTGAEPGEWNAAIKDGKVEVAQGAPQAKPTMTLTADSADYVKIFTGELDGMQIFVLGLYRHAR